MPLWTSDQSSSVTAVIKSGTSSENLKLKLSSYIYVYVNVIIFSFWYYPLVDMWSNDTSLCLLTQRDPLKSDFNVTKQICLEKSL